MIQSCGRFGDKVRDFLVGAVIDAETGCDRFTHKISRLIGRWVGKQMLCIIESETLSGMRGICEGRGVPEVFGVRRVELC